MTRLLGKYLRHDWMKASYLRSRIIHTYFPNSDLSSFSHMPGVVRDLVLSTLFINVLSLALPLALLQIYDRIIPNSAAGTLVLLVTGVGMALILEAVLRQARSYVSGRMGARFEHMAGTTAMERLVKANLTDFEKQGPGVHLERFNGMSTVKEFYAGQAILVLCDFPFAILFLGVIAYLAGVLVLVPAAFIVFFSIFAIVLGRRLRKSLNKRQIADERRFNFIIEALGGIHTIKAMAMENQILRRYERLQESCTQSSYQLNFDSSSALGVGASCAQMSTFALAGLGSLLVMDGSLTVGGLIACTMLTGRSLQPLQKALGIWARFQSLRLARRQFREILDLQQEVAEGLPPLPTIDGAVELRDVTFGFGKNKDGEELPPVFEGVNLQIRAGETVGIVGGSASGKSTLLSLMTGVLQPTHGQVLVDGHDLSKTDPASVRRQVVYAPQQGVLFNGTILENITMFRPDLEELALETAELLGLDGIVNRMPFGFETRVGASASDILARSVKQRIIVARALVNRPRVLLFDEANASMDSRGDTILHSVLKGLKGRCTLVLVSHRPSTLKLADHIYDLVDGRLIHRKPQQQQDHAHAELRKPA